uniref:Uncharacterized protein n=1 Tax=Manihot esculenta TaxID=3983 RepID=A0A2C9WC32_MANES
MNVFPSGDVGDVPAANAQPGVDGSENVKGVPTSLTDLGFSSEFERQLQLENDPELKFISLHELDNDDVFLALHDIIVTRNTNMAYDHVHSEMTVMDSTPNMVRSHGFSSGENPPFNFGYDQFFSSDDKGKGVVVDETPSHNFVLDHVGPYKETEVVTPTLDMANVDYDFPFEEMGDDQSQELQPPSVLFTTDLKPRLRWTFELHQCFLKAVNDLGGPKS